MVPRSSGLNLDKAGLKKGPTTPHVLQLTLQDSVCPMPFSVALTNGIPIGFFSCGY